MSHDFDKQKKPMVATVGIPGDQVLYEVDLEKKETRVVKSLQTKTNKQGTVKMIAFEKVDGLIYVSAKNKIHAEKKVARLIQDIIDGKEEHTSLMSNKKTLKVVKDESAKEEE